MKNSSGFLTKQGVTFLKGQCIGDSELEEFELDPTKLVKIYLNLGVDDVGCYTANDTVVKKQVLERVPTYTPRDAIKSLQQAYNLIFNSDGIEYTKEKKRRFKEGLGNLIDLLKDGSCDLETIPLIIKNEPIFTIGEALRCRKTKLEMPNPYEKELSDLIFLKEEFDRMRQMDVRKMQSYDIRKIPDMWTSKEL